MTRKSLKLPVILIVMAGTAIPDAQSSLIINELTQSNIDIVFDDLNEFPDSWVELYNPDEAPVNLATYSISDEDNPSKAYRLPELTIEPGGYTLVFCDKAATGLHTDFRLDSGKGASVYLFEDGKKVDSVSGLKKQPAPNIAYGRKTDASDEWGYMQTPTPGASNCGKTVTKILGDPIFSVPGRIGNTPLLLELTVPDDAPSGTLIHYTLDGSEPTQASPAYATPIQIESTSTVRATLFCDGYLSPRSTTHSYIFHPREMTIPIVSIVSDDSYFYDQKTGILTDGSDPDNPNYNHDWRRPVNLEYFTSENTGSQLNQLCETRVKGGSSRIYPLKSLVTYANKRFGVKRFEQEFFPEDAPGLTEWKSFELRNAGSDFIGLYMRDAVIQRLMGKRLDIDWQPCQPTAVYINGRYQGLLNLRSRSNEDHVYTFYDGLEDIELWERWWELKAGDGSLMAQFRPFFMGDPHTVAEYRQWIDVGEYMDVMILNIFFINLDFPGNNIIQWRPTAENGLWRWIVKDTDLGMGLYGRPYDYMILDWWTDSDFDPDTAPWANTPGATAILRHMLMDPEGKDMFIDRLGAYMGDFLTLRAVSAEIDRHYDIIKPEFDATFAIYGYNPGRMPTMIAEAKEWTANRVEFFYSDMARFFGLGKPIKLTIDSGRDDDLTINVNGHDVSHRDYDGKWWAGRTLRLSGKSSDGNTVAVKWTIRTTRDGVTSEETFDTEHLEYTVPDADSIAIETVTGISSLTDITSGTQQGFDPRAPFEAFDMSGRMAGVFSSASSANASLEPGIYIFRQGAVTSKHIVR